MGSQIVRWRGREVSYAVQGAGPDVVLCHGTPWSSAVWEAQVAALSADFRVHTWDMPGYGASSKRPEHPVDLVFQGELLAHLLDEWGLSRPRVVAHDIGGAVALRAHLLHGVDLESLCLVDTVVIRPWGSPFYTLVQENAAVFAQLPDPIHAAVVREYVRGAGVALDDAALDDLVRPWLGTEGKPAFYRQIADTRHAHTDEIESRLGEVRCRRAVIWGEHDTWLPVEVGRELAARLGVPLQVISGAGHLVQLDQPALLTAAVRAFLES